MRMSVDDFYLFSIQRNHPSSWYSWFKTLIRLSQNDLNLFKRIVRLPRLDCHAFSRTALSLDLTGIPPNHKFS